MIATNGLSVGAWFRQFHSWVAVVFIVTVVATFVARARGTPPLWVIYSPLFPLALLSLTGLYLFAQPYSRWRRQGGA